MKIIVAIVFLLFIIAPIARSNSVVTQWNQLVLDTIVAARPAPPVVSRALYVVHNAIYDAWTAYDNVAIGSRFGGLLRRPLAERTTANKIKAVSYAAFTAYNDLFPAFLANSTALLTSLGFPLDNSTDLTQPQGVGNAVGNCLVKYRHGDGSNQLGDLNNGAPYSDYTGYTLINTATTVNDPNYWQPLTVNGNVQKYAGPHWGNVQTFANDVWPPLVDPINIYPSTNFTKQAQEVLDYSANLTDSQKMVAEFFAGGPGSVTPPGYWNQFAQFISNRDSYDIDRDIKLFFLLNAAMFDASVVCWGVKRYYNSVRPITAIRFLFNGQTVRAWGGVGMGTQNIMGQNWIPYQASNVVTPPFPAFYSGHSSFSSAAAIVLQNFTGSDNFGFTVTFPKGSSGVEPGVTPQQDLTLSYPTFTSAAQAAGISRLYGGIHFSVDNTNGLAGGPIVAKNVLVKGYNLFNGVQFGTNTPSPSPKPSSASSLMNLMSFVILNLIFTIVFIF